MYVKKAKPGSSQRGPVTEQEATGTNGNRKWSDHAKVPSEHIGKL